MNQITGRAVGRAFCTTSCRLEDDRWRRARPAVVCRNATRRRRRTQPRRRAQARSQARAQAGSQARAAETVGPRQARLGGHALQVSPSAGASGVRARRAVCVGVRGAVLRGAGQRRHAVDTGQGFAGQGCVRMQGAAHPAAATNLHFSRSTNTRQDLHVWANRRVQLLHPWTQFQRRLHDSRPAMRSATPAGLQQARLRRSMTPRTGVQVKEAS